LPAKIEDFGMKMALQPCIHMQVLVLFLLHSRRSLASLLKTKFDIFYITSLVNWASALIRRSLASLRDDTIL
jgi:hypothetical protein